MLISRRILPQGLAHRSGVADHALVAYDFGQFNLLDCPRKPVRVPFDFDRLRESAQSRLDEYWDDAAFCSLLQSHSAEDAFQMLSKAAEFALQTLDALPSACVPKSQLWLPRVAKSVSKSAAQSQSILLTRSRRLYRRLAQLQLDSGNVALQTKCYHGLAALSP